MTTAALIGILFIEIIVYGQPQKIPIDLDVIVAIESSGRAKAFNRHTCARGLFQITPIVLTEWNERNPQLKFKLDDLFDPKINTEIAKWYLGQRIPELLEHYGKELNLKNILICWNAGIRYVVLNDRIPYETQQFIEKYEKIYDEKKK